MNILDVDIGDYSHEQFREYARFMDVVYLHQMDYLGDPYKAAILRAIYLEEFEFNRGCSASSLSESLKIPRETVRRKASKLIERGWLRLEGAVFRLNVQNISDEKFYRKIGYPELKNAADIARILDRYLATAERIKQVGN